MTLRCVTLAVVVAACGFTPGTIGGDASGDAMASDRDEDGIVDASDNCADIANTTQRDFDTDGTGDECDLCPHIANASLDSDGDLIGDACDPRPTIGGDQRVVWNAFRDAAEIAGWNATAGSWMLSAGGISQSDVAVSPAGFGPPLMVQKAFVMTQMRFEVAGDDVDELAGVSTGSVPGTQYYACSTGMHDPGPVKFIGAFTRWSGSPGQQEDTDGWPGTVVGGTFEIIASPVTSLSCTFTQAGQADATLVAPGGLGPTSGNAYLYTQYAAATFRYMFVVEIGS